MSSQLPQGWSAYQNSDGRWYFVNSATGTTQWHHPLSPPPAAPQQPTSQEPASKKPASQHVGSSAQSQGHKMSSGAARYVLSQPVEFKLKEKAFSLSGDSFSVKRADTGEATFKVKGNAISLKDSKSIQDANGAAIYKMSEAILSLRGRMSIVDAKTKEPVVILRKKGYLPSLKAKTIQVWAGGKDEGTPYLEVKGDFLRKDFKVIEVASKRTVASIKRKSFNISNLLLDKDSYVVRVEPGVDTALLVFLVVAVDEQFRDDGHDQGLL